MKKVDNHKLGILQDAYHKRRLTLNLKQNAAPTLVLQSVDAQEVDKQRQIPLI